LGTWALGPVGSWALGLLGTWALEHLGTWALGHLGTWGLITLLLKGDGNFPHWNFSRFLNHGFGSDQVLQQPWHQEEGPETIIRNTLRIKKVPET
jgi:hypothetical protein